MSIYAYELEDLLTSIESSVSALNSYVSSANSATTQSTYNSYVAKYDAELANYENLVNQFSDTQEDYERYITVNKVSSFTAEIPNIKDKNQNLPGGEFGDNGAMPGGFLWSPTDTANMEVSRPSVKNNAKLLQGEILPFLGWGLGKINSQLQGGALNLMFDDKIRSTEVVSFTITITLPSGISTTMSKELSYSGDGENSNDASFNYNGAQMSLTELQGMMNYSNSMDSNLVGMLAGMTKLGSLPMGTTLAVAAYNLATGQEFNFSHMVGQALTNQVMGTFSSMVTKGLVSALGVTSVPMALGIHTVVGVVFGELFEMAVGLDNHFGFGGDYMKMGDDGRPEYERASSFTQMLRTTTIDIFGYATAASILGGITDEDRYEQWEQLGFSVSDVGSAMTQADSPNDNDWDKANTFADIDFKTGDFDFNGDIKNWDDSGGVNDNNAGGWGDGGSNNTDGMGNNSNDTSGVGDQSASEGGYGDGNGGFGGI